jgi:hypothetical protein
MKVPKTPCPVGGKVPWVNGVWPIASRKQHPVLGWLYVIHEKRSGDGLVIWANVSQEDIVKKMEEVARYKPGMLLDLGGSQKRRVLGRKWHFERATFFYLIEGKRGGESFTLDEVQLTARIKGATESVA